MQDGDRQKGKKRTGKKEGRGESGTAAGDLFPRELRDW
ncbi:hypothetical protein DESPIGER_0420 [Desulfovibrio piger]|uniref:Uncharacterized protein n=1 Tax=Desulfovibrio piger TaxID=901 RepID=A0A1K1LFT9_9BACT|nr:hypothetical protein DESPIGER_0420 [Desulfovibrio piger]